MHPIKRNSLSFFFFLSVFSAFAQNDTLFFDSKWQESSKNAAAYFRPPLKAEGKGYRLKDYYLSGKLQMSAITLQREAEVFDGKATWYYNSGEIQQISNYQNGELEGEFILFAKNGAVLSKVNYEKGEPTEGTIYYTSDEYAVLETYKNTLLTTKTISDTEKRSLARIDVFYDKNIMIKIDYFDQLGKLVGSATEFDNNTAILKGTLVQYFPNPMHVSSICSLENGAIIGTRKTFYITGKLKKEEFFEENTLQKEVYFDKEGNAKATLIYDQSGRPQNGIRFVHFSDFPSFYPIIQTDSLQFVYPYKDGMLEGTVLQFHPNGQLAMEETYVEDIRQGNVKYYLPSGELEFEGVYENGNPHSGTFRDEEGTVRKFEEGVMQEERAFKNGKLISLLTKDQIKYSYDSTGKQISKLILRDGYPFEGIEIVRDYELITHKEYKNGAKISVQMCDQSGRFISKEYLDSNENIVRRVDYYITGQKKIDATYTPVASTLYFDKKGKNIGKLTTDRFKNGTEYVFEMDRITNVFFYKNDTLKRSIVYSSDNKVVCDRNFFGKSVFYDKAGVLLGTAIYKDEKPFEGKVFYYDENNVVEEFYEYKNGKYDGNFITYSTDYTTKETFPKVKGTYKKGKLEGPYSEYYQNVLRKVSVYENDLVTGEVQFYDELGKLVSKATYKDDLPIEGTVYEFDSEFHLRSTKTYANGDLDGITTIFQYDNELLLQTILQTEEYKEGDLQGIAYYENNEPKYKVSYQNGAPFDGTELSYNNLIRYSQGNIVSETSFYDDAKTQKASVTNYVDRAISLVETYFQNSQKESVISYSNGLKNGQASFYSRKGKQIAQGTYQDGVPLAGSFIYTNKNNETDFIKLDLTKKNTFKASFFQDNKLVYNFTGQKIGSEAMLEDVEKFIEMIGRKAGYEYVFE